MGSIRRRRGLLGAGASVVAVGSLAIGLGATSAVASHTAKPAVKSPHATKVKGGTAYFAEGAGAVPNYIFPFRPVQFLSVTNVGQFQQLMYRPLYWFGQGTTPDLNASISLAGAPSYSSGNTVVKFTLKPYKWSDGETVTAQDVVFFMNMDKVEKLDWAGYSAGTMPDDVKSVTTSGDTVTMTLTGSVNPYWFTYNELGQITPMPVAWDVSAAGQKSGSQLCGTSSYQAVTVNTAKAGTDTPVSAAAKSCAAVFTYLSKESGFDPSNPKAPNNSLSTYATNPLWQVVDGPWHLASFSSSGYAAFKPNPDYSGPVKPSLSEFVELPYTSSTAEFNALVGGKLTVGYLPYEDVTAKAKSPTVSGPNNPRLSNFTIAPWYPWGINYFPYNFNSIGDGGEAGKIFHQLYFRQAMQELVDQNLYIDRLFKGYAVPTYGPVPVLPKNDFATSFEETDPYPYSVSSAEKLLKDNGWTIHAGGADVCADVSKCGVLAGTKLSFVLQYSVPTAAETQEMEAEKATWAEAGIQVNLSTSTFDTVIGNATACSGSSCTWEMENWAGGWTYAPNYYPTGEILFQTGAGSNVGSYSSAENDSLIKQTDFGTATLATWENYLAKQLPYVFQPEEAYQLTEVQNSLKGALPQNVILNLTPENWYFTK